MKQELNKETGRRGHSLQRLDMQREEVDAAIINACAPYEQVIACDLHKAQDTILLAILDGTTTEEGEEISVDEAGAYILVEEVRRLREDKARLDWLNNNPSMFDKVFWDYDMRASIDAVRKAEKSHNNEVSDAAKANKQQL